MRIGLSGVEHLPSLPELRAAYQYVPTELLILRSCSTKNVRNRKRW